MASTIESDKDKCFPFSPNDCINNDETKDDNPNPTIVPVINPEDNNLVWQEMMQTEKLLASDLLKLSVQERAKAMDDLHCVTEEVEESPRAMERLLAEFEVLVQRDRHPTYNVAVRRNKAYVEDRSFRLRFLRCNQYDVARSVSQMMKFLQHKATYFGEEKVARDITIDDLNTEDMGLLMSGQLCHIQEERDQSGRVVQYLVMTEMFGRCTTETMIRVAFYVQNNVLIPIPEAQMKGVVGVYYDATKPGESFKMPGFVSIVTMIDIFRSFPLRYSAVHICLKPRRSNLLLNNTFLHNILNITSVHTRTRTRIHYGSDMEMQYSLRSHGVPIESFPIDMDGNIRMENMNRWFVKHETEVRLNRWMATQPRPTDVLLGRGYRVQNHVGNAHFRNFLLDHREEYDNAPQALRQEITIRLTRTLLENGTRFLKRTEAGQWVPISPREAEQKVGQLFRTFRKKEPSNKRGQRTTKSGRRGS